MSFEMELRLMTTAAREAGTAILHYFRLGETVSSAADVRHKGHDNPLTEADLEADRLLHRVLLRDRPDYGWLSEETVDDLTRLERSRVWVVDPIDGTKEFIIGLPQFAISIGLVEEGLPVAACIFNPAAGEMFTATRGSGTRLNDQPIHTTLRSQLAGSTCLASRSETKRGEWDRFRGELELTTMGSIAYKLALLARGAFDLTFTLTPKNEWDFCAGALLVAEAGGRVTDKDGMPFRFNQRRETRTPSLVASNGPLHAALLERLEDVPLSPDRHRPSA
ncbi:MAG: 3'(2'),5'-bisphosphate nucleotidase CysQ [Magnetococcales bacterium]|nr:3'(2'),5'-bisphosphate nucleotidase CysQ [Magnetococcales bacterium]